MDGTLETIGGRPALRFERRYSHSINRVWQAISDPAEIERWSPGVAPWTPAAGEHIEAYGMTGEVTEVEPPRRLAWSFNGDDYSFDLEPDGDGCKLVFVYVFNDRSGAPQTAAGWELYLARLEAHLAGGYLSEEEAHQGVELRIERYAELFGGASAT